MGEENHEFVLLCLSRANCSDTVRDVIMLGLEGTSVLKCFALFWTMLAFLIIGRRLGKRDR